MAGRAVRPSLPRDRRDALTGRRARARSSAGQSARLISVRSAVRVGPGPPSLRGWSAVSEFRGPPPLLAGGPARRRVGGAAVPFHIVWWRRASRPPGPLGPAEAGLTGGCR